MKKLFYLIALIVIASCSQVPKDGFVIKGTITGDDPVIKEGKAYLANRNRQNPVRDTVDIVNGKFKFTGSVTEPEMYFLTIEGLEERVPVFLENNVAFIVKADVEDIQNAEIIGGINHEIMNKYNKFASDLSKENNLDEIMAEYQTAEEKRREEIIEIYQDYSSKVGEFEKELIAANPTSFYAYSNLLNNMIYMSLEDLEEKIAVFKNDPDFIAESITRIDERIAKLKELQPGQPAIDFTLPDTKGKDVSLSSIYKKNKVTMIDFWAGWCGPCRNFNPKLVEIYKQYHKKGFEVFGVSFDRDRDTWLKAIKDDKLPWIQVSDLNYFNTESAKLYGINFIPSNVFVNQEGKIIAYQLEKDKIVEFLEEHLK